MKNFIRIVIIFTLIIGTYGGYILYEGYQNTQQIISKLDTYFLEEPTWTTDFELFDELHTKANTEFCLNLADDVKIRITELSTIKGNLNYNTYSFDQYLEYKKILESNSLITADDKKYIGKVINKKVQKKLSLINDEMDTLLKMYNSGEYDLIKDLSLTSIEFKSVIQTYGTDKKSEDKQITYSDINILLKMDEDGYWSRIEKLPFDKVELRKIINFYKDGKLDIMEKFIVHEEMNLKKKNTTDTASTISKPKSSDPIEISNIKYTGDKVSFSVKNNTSSIITYLKFDIRIYDSNENVIDTDWTNWSGNLQPDDKAKVDAYVTEGMSIAVEVSEIVN